MNPHLSDLSEFIVASPTAYHAAAECVRRLRAGGFAEQDRAQVWDVAPGGHFLVHGGAVLAWWIPESAGPASAYRIVGAHTDSPGFKVKPNPQLRRYGTDQIGVEIYGGPLIASWTDRDLGLAGRLVDEVGNSALVRTGPIMRIPQLAIHLNRAIGTEGLRLDRQAHTMPIIGLGGADLLQLLTAESGLAGRPVGFDVYAFDTQAPATIGVAEEFFTSGRLDNLSSVHAGLVALLAGGDHGVGDDQRSAIRVLVAFDHEEVGSQSSTGAAGPLLAEVLERTGFALGADADAHRAMLARSSCVSADTGHAVHPNYPERHDPAHQPVLNAGTLLKINADQRYATDGIGAALWTQACRRAGVGMQPFVSNNDVPCGSTIGPITATRIGVTTVDVGVPLLSMHSVRELAGSQDLIALAAALRAYLWS